MRYMQEKIVFTHAAAPVSRESFNPNTIGKVAKCAGCIRGRERVIRVISACFACASTGASYCRGVTVENERIF